MDNQLIIKYSPVLNEIRKRLMFTAIIFATAMFAGFFFYENIIRLLIDILSIKGVNIVFTSPFQFINLALSCGFSIALMLTFPLLIYQVLSFLKPALKIKEFVMVVRFLPFSILLFFSGFAFGVLIMRWQIQIFLEKSVSLGIGNILDISNLLSTVFLTAALMGLAFQFPVFLLMLLRLRVLKQSQLSKKRLWVYLGSFIFAMLLPPDSILADVLLSLPIIILFELTLILNRIFEHKPEN